MTRRLLAIALSFIVALVAAPAVASAESVRSPKWVQIVSKDGTPLHAMVFVPQRTAPGQLRPGIALAAAWNGGAEQNYVPAYRLAQKGYVVISYTTRGTGKDGKGKVEMGGPKDIEDMSAIIDWMIATQSADPDRIGAAGFSYGAGIALMAAGVDSRIKAVMSASGWTDLDRALYPHQTRNSWAGFILWASARMASHVGPEFIGVFNNFFANRNPEFTIDFAHRRSAESFINQINANRPAVMLAQGWNELAFPPDQIVDFFKKLQGPRLMVLRPGDHVGQESLGLLGLYNPVLNRMYKFFDDTLRDPSRREEIGSKIEIKPRAPYGGTPVESYTDWSQISSSEKTWNLGPVVNKKRDSVMTAATDAPQTGWSRTLKPAWMTANWNGGPIVSHWTEVWGWRPMWGRVKEMDRDSTATFFSSQPMGQWTILRGEPKIHLTVTSAYKVGTIVATLWSVGADGEGRHITHAPFTWRNATPNQPFTVDLPLRPNAFNIPPHHKLLLAVSTGEWNYFLEKNKPGARITLSSPAGNPSTISIPLK